MTYPFFGGECEAFNRSSTSIVESTAGGSYDSAYARCSIQCSNANVADYLETLPFGALTTAWLHWDSYMPWSLDSGNPFVIEYNSTGTAVFQIVAASSSTIKCQYWSGSAWTDIGAAVAYSTSLSTLDLKVVCGGSGSFELYIGNVLATSGSASMASVNNIDKARFFCQSATNTHNNFVSQIIAASVITVQHKLFTRPPTGNSTVNTAWTGDYTAVDETILDDTDFISSSTAGDTETYTHGSISIATGIVKAVGVSARVRNDGSAPTNVKGALRIGSTNYLTANLPSVGSGFGAALAIWETDPSTSAAWLNANAVSTSLEFGLQSAT